MTDREIEQMLGETLKQDCSIGTEAFRDELLTRCLEVFAEKEESVELGDDELEMLAAAGDLASLGLNPPEMGMYRPDIATGLIQPEGSSPSLM